MTRRFPGLKAVACPLGLSPAFELGGQKSNDGARPFPLEAADGHSRRLGSSALLLVARMHPGEREKGHYELLGILPELRRRFSDVQLVFAGPGDDRVNLERVAHEKGVADAVFFPGKVPSAFLEELYQRCYAFVMPSRQEGFGLVYLEAMNQAKPCVGCFDQGAEDVIVDGETGFLLHDPRDSKELLNALCALLANPDHAREMGRRGFARLRGRFTAGHFQGRVKHALRQFLADARGS